MRPRDPAWRHSAAAFLLAAAFFPAAAADKTCSPSEMTSAEKAIDGVTSWAALEKAVRNYSHCDQGQASEMFNEAMLRVLIGGWPKVAEAEPLLEGNPAFRAWISKRLVNPAIHKDDTDSVRGLAKSSCPAGRARLCEYFRDALDANKPIIVPSTIEIAKPADPPAKK